ncbi:MAG: hypothetical protein ACLQBA_24810 [Candidatus Binataceae bacterium]
MKCAGVLLAATAVSGCISQDYPIGALLHPQLVAARQQHLAALRQQCQAGDCQSDCAYKVTVMGDPPPGEPERAACRILCENRDSAACIDYQRKSSEVEFGSDPGGENHRSLLEQLLPAPAQQQ